ncbi:MAG: lamin tail domain-containing protein [Patescibacteria group bacterium]|nr:lamin tail domain-containing protein [Patescibacteria group bacterium]
MRINKNLKQTKQLLLVTALSVLFLSPSFVFSQIEITEVMYNLEGSDSGREWIEIYNTTTEDVDLSGWKVFEAETNHRIKSIIEGDSLVLPTKTYALIIDNFEKFEVDYPNFSGLVFDSAFSLSNSGEGLILRDDELIDVDSVDYLSEWGANGDGDSLQKIDSTWQSGTPTPACTNGGNQPDEPVEENDEIIPPSEQEDQGLDLGSGSILFVSQIKAHIISFQDIPIAGADFMFKGESLGLENQPIENAKYSWSFGDGSRVAGQNVLHAFQYPGEYLITLEVSSGKHSAMDRVKTKVISSGVFIKDVLFDDSNSFVNINNPSQYELNLSWWRLKVGDNFWTFPKNTIMLADNQLKLSSHVTNLFPKEGDDIQLLYPNGSIAFDYRKESVIDQKIVVPIPVVPQVANINKATKPLIEEVEPEEDGEVILEDKTETATSSDLQQQVPVDDFDEPLINKWTISLMGIVSLAITGVVFATKLDE